MILCENRVHTVCSCNTVHVDSVSSEISSRELRNQLTDTIGRAMCADERSAVTRYGKLATAVIGMADLEALEAFEMAQDVSAHREAEGLTMVLA